MPANQSSPATEPLAFPGTLAGIHFRPSLTPLLESLGLNVVYERGQGNILTYRTQEGTPIDVLDLVGGYGSLLLGHSHPELVAEAVRLLTECRPMHAQGSVPFYAHRLASELSRRAGGDYCVVFANSGAEVVEAALKHALLETRGRSFIALEGAFHGKSLAALQMTANRQYRDGFEFPGLTVARVPANDLEALEAAFAERNDLAGFLFEPIQGEGGVRPLTAAFCQRAAALCTARGIPLIADECQTGLGRTGTFLACEPLQVQPDYILLSKSLGGGLAKVAALLIRRDRYVGEFDLKHTSTFAADDYSSAIALKTLEILDGPMLARGRIASQQLLDELTALARRFPSVIAEVRGRGMMIGVEFRKLSASGSLVLRFLSAQEDLTFVVAGYLLRQHRIRVAPTLSDRWTLRLEPSLLLDSNQIAQTLVGFEELCGRLRNDDAPGLTVHLARQPKLSAPCATRVDGKFFARDGRGFQERLAAVRGPRVAWLCHLVDADNIIPLEAAFEAWQRGERERLLERLAGRAWPVALNPVEIRSRTGATVGFCPILLPVTSAWIRQQLDGRDLRNVARLVQNGVDMARDLGCELVALGQYTSIVTRNGTRIDGRGMGLTTGNSYALALALQALERCQRKRGRAPEDSVLVVVGAAGNIGRAAAQMLAPLYRETILVGRDRPGSRRRLEALGQQIPRSRSSDSLGQVAAGDAVLIATSAVDAPLRPGHFKKDAIVCDLSVPGAVAAEGSSLPPGVVFIRGGLAFLPSREDLGIGGFPLPSGQVYGCMAEGMLLSLEGIRDSTFTGGIDSVQVKRIEALAQRHGFELADDQVKGVLGCPPEKMNYAIVS